ncbi:MAG: hypothetical protein WCO20_03375 [Holophagaceae bacterium]|nr:hypothetical protein [Acidobacteriota bacterium]
MRTSLILPALLLTLACGSKLDKSKAENLIRKGYPVQIPVIVPEQATAQKGTPEYARLVTLRDNLAATDWFEISTKEEGKRETTNFALKPSAPPSIKPMAKGLQAGFSVPVAQAGFVRAVKVENAGDGVKVSYEIRLQNPTAQFPLFLAIHPEAKLGETKARHATFQKRAGTWELMSTNETFSKVQ